MSIFPSFQILALVCLLSSGALADTLIGNVEARQLTDKVMSKVGAGEIRGGLELMKPYLIIPPAEFDVMLDQVNVQLPAMTQRFGNSIGYEFIREDKVGESLFRMTYIHRLEKHPMRWTFYFYNGKEGWVLNTFKSDDDIQQLFP